MKILAAVLLVALPANAMDSGTSEPEAGCDFAKGYCVVSVETFHEIMQNQKRRCTELDT